MGEVYRARDTKLDRDVAIKVLPDDVAAHPERVARFEREAKALAALGTPMALPREVSALLAPWFEELKTRVPANQRLVPAFTCRRNLCGM
jgi:serine/threonine protein kinase